MILESKNIFKYSMLAIGMFSVAVLANYTATKIMSEDTKHKRQGLIAATLAVGVSALILAQINGAHEKIVTAPM